MPSFAKESVVVHRRLAKLLFGEASVSFVFF